MNDMGYRIKQKRLESGLTGDELGKLLGVQRAAVSKWENGDVENIKRSTVIEMARIFNCSPAWLMAFDAQNIAANVDSDMYKRIHQLRIAHNMTLQNLGDKLGVGKSTVRKWETGEIKHVRSDKVLKLALAFDVTPDYLILGKSDKDIDVPNRRYATLASGNMTVGERIRNRRKQLCLTQLELAQRMGLKDKTSVCKIELGGDNITVTTIRKFAAALDVDPCYLMGWNVEDDHAFQANDYKLTINGNDYHVKAPKEMSEDMIKRMLAYFDKLLALSEKDQTMVMSILDAVIKKED